MAWRSLAKAHREREIDTTIDARDVVSKSIPQKMGAAIKATPGWFGDKGINRERNRLRALIRGNPFSGNTAHATVMEFFIIAI